MNALKLTIQLCIAAATILGCACHRSNAPLYVQFDGPDQVDSWDPFEELSYEINLPKETPVNASFSLLLSIRHSGSYKSDRLKLIITRSEEGREYTPDTVTVMLADSDGKWKGTRSLGIYTLSTALNSNFRPDSTTTFSIRPDSPKPIAGISKIGLSLTSR